MKQLRPMNKELISQLIIILIGTFVSGYADAQEKGLILSQYYSPTEYKSGTQNWCIAQDNRGVMYFGNALGVLEYDGDSWRLISSQILYSF